MGHSETNTWQTCLGGGDSGVVGVGRKSTSGQSHELGHQEVNGAGIRHLGAGAGHVCGRGPARHQVNETLDGLDGGST